MSEIPKVLTVVEDEEHRTAIVEFVASLGYETEEAVDAIEGLRKAEQYEPDIIIATKKLSPYPGKEFLQKVQAQEPTIGLFLMGSDVHAHTKTVQLGAINFLPCPSSHDAEIVRAKLQAYLNGRNRLSRPFSRYSGVKVLLVEDEENERAGLATLLTHWGYHTATAEDGLEGLRKIKSFRPDIVLTDVKMPVMSGLELLEKALPQYPGTGFFVITGVGSIQTAVTAVKLGAVSYLQKPIPTDSLRAELQAYLDSRQPPLRAFLCHSSEDKESVRRLHRRLKRDLIDTWLDEERIVPGQNWDFEIGKAVKKSDVVIVCLSAKSVTKEGYVQKEIRLALDMADQKPDGAIFLIPARLEECTVPDRLRRWQWVNLFEPKGYGKLLNALRQRAGTVPLRLWAESPVP